MSKSRQAAIFELRQVTFTYPKREPILRGVDLVMGEGDFLLLRGPSGGGKSTLLKLLNGLLIPMAGEIRFRLQPLDALDLPLFRRRVVYVQQVPAVLDATVRENLFFPFRFRSAGAAAPSDDSLREQLHVFRLGGLSLDADADGLSTGEKQRLALIRALLLQPEVLLLDEPTAALDPVSRSVVEEQVERLNLKAGVTVIMAGHTDYQPAGPRFRLIHLEDGVLREIAP